MSGLTSIHVYKLFCQWSDFETSLTPSHSLSHTPTHPLTHPHTHTHTHTQNIYIQLMLFLIIFTGEREGSITFIGIRPGNTLPNI